MDTSETYIKMRLVAIPDLGMGIPPQYPNFKIWKDVRVDSKGDWYHFGSDGLFQLERQDQLQEMVEEKDPIRLIDDLSEWTTLPMWIQLKPSSKAKPLADKFYENMERLTSMEQLWLAFVMKEKYDKVWDGENWVKEK